MISVKILGGYTLRGLENENFAVGSLFDVNTFDMFGAFRNINKCSIKLYAADNANGVGSSRNMQKLHQS